MTEPKKPDAAEPQHPLQQPAENADEAETSANIEPDDGTTFANISPDNP
jgi:hypothetical protein